MEFAKAEPHRVYATACRLGFEDETKSASQLTSLDSLSYLTNSGSSLRRGTIAWSTFTGSTAGRLRASPTLRGTQFFLVLVSLQWLTGYFSQLHCQCTVRRLMGRFGESNRSWFAVSQVFSWDPDMGHFFYVRLVWPRLASETTHAWPMIIPVSSPNHPQTVASSVRSKVPRDERWMS
jgi:hypothetical protein